MVKCGASLKERKVDSRSMVDQSSNEKSKFFELIDSSKNNPKEKLGGIATCKRVYRNLTGVVRVMASTKPHDNKVYKN